MATEITGQKINGATYGFSSIELVAATANISAFDEIEYTTELEPGIYRGNQTGPLVRTKGEGNHTGKLTLLKADANTILRALGQGALSVEFQIIVKYQTPGSPIITDVLNGCRITNAGNAHSGGGDALKVTFDLHIMQILYDSDLDLLA